MPARARVLRKNQTDAEKRLWYHLRNRQMAGCKFRRQHPVGPYITDFACTEKRLVIELDGGQHALRVEKDDIRTSYLKSRGFNVVRFWDNDVLIRTEAVLKAIRGILEKAPSPRPSPPPAVERG